MIREGLAEDLRRVAQECTVDNYPDILTVRKLLYEAADALVEAKVRRTIDTKGVFLNGNDILNQIDAINRRRAKEGMPPI